MPYANKEKERQHRKLYNEKNRAEKKQYNQKYRENNRERIRGLSKTWAKNNPLVVKNYTFKRRYGITISDYNKLLETQNGGCAICGILSTNFKKSLHVDHCHTTNKIRGLLCTNCNTALGHIKENISLIQRAIENNTDALDANAKKAVSKFGNKKSNLQKAIIYLTNTGERFFS